MFKVFQKSVAIIAAISALVSCSKSSTTSLPQPIAGFTFQSSSQTAPDTVSFSNSSLNAASYLWDFGDGGSKSNVINPSHIYTKGGTYTIKLIATSASGAIDSTVRSITIVNPTTLRVKVIDILGNPISGATVTLYNNLNDFNNFTNPVASTITNASGYFNFSSNTSNISTVAYYYYISNGCKDNINNATHFLAPLVANTLNTYNNIILTSKGTIKLVNSSTNPYEIYIDGVYKGFLNGGYYWNFPYETVASHTVRVLQKSGYLVFPTDKTFIVTITGCGNIQTVNFP